MMFSHIRERMAERFPSRVQTIDSHTAGEPTRLIISHADAIPGSTMKDKLFYYRENLDFIRLRLTREPRGNRAIMAAQLTEAVTPGADFGLIYMDARRYPYLCGHATIGAVATLIELGAIQVEEPDAKVLVDTPSGPMETWPEIRNGRVESVAIRMVPSFVYDENQPLDVPNLGRILVDTVCVGGFFVMVSSEQTGLELIPENNQKLIRLGMDIIDVANQQLSVRHPTRPEVTTVDVTEFYDPSTHPERKGINAVVYGESHMDASPCGTGTAAKMTLLHHRGELGEDEPFLNSGPLGTMFQGRIVSQTRVGDLDAVVTEIRGNAHITGIHEFVTDPSDPFPKGFLR